MKIFGNGVVKSVLTAILALPLVASAVNVAPGGFTLAVSEPDPFVGSTVVQSLNAPFASPSFSGSLESAVLAGDTSNPFGGLTFTYRINLSQASQQAATQITISSFGGFQTDFSYNNSGTIIGGVVPTYFSRSTEAPGIGEVARFHFLAPTILPGQSSALLVVQTSSQAWNFTTAGLSDGVTLNVGSLAPLAVPEPAALSLIALGFGVLCLRRKH